MNIFFIGATQRLDLGFENPNKAAALIVGLLVGVWVFPALVEAGKRSNVKAILWWVALGVSVILGWCLLITGSRGGVCAAIAGLGAVAWLQRAEWTKRKFAVVCAFLVLAVVLSFFLPQTERFSPVRSVNDDSIRNRWLLWKNIPAMIVAAPDGWGIGNAGEAFMEWYQAPERTEVYRTLVNSHGTWLVEFGWMGRIAYLLAWALAFRLAWPDKNTRLPAAPFGTLLAFFLTAVFSSVAEAWSLWIPPCALLFVMLFLRWKKGCFCGWINLFSWVISPVVTVCVAILLIGFQAKPRLRVEGNGATVRIGDEASRMVIVLGENAKETPRNLREDKKRATYFEGTTWTLCPREEMFSEQSTLVVFGEWSAEELTPLLKKPVRILLFSTTCWPEDFSADVEKKTQAIFGEFSAGSPVAQAWQMRGSARIIPGMADYISNWAELLTDLKQQ
jgi:hypothetical protein